MTFTSILTLVQFLKLNKIGYRSKCRPTAQAARRWLLTQETLVQHRVTLSDGSDTAAGVPQEFFGFSPANHHSNTAPYSSITAPRGVR
jgi:hypothetical protein